MKNGGLNSLKKQELLACLSGFTSPGQPCRFSKYRRIMRYFVNLDLKNKKHPRVHDKINMALK